jgi:hypothetical protein
MDWLITVDATYAKPGARDLEYTFKDTDNQTCQAHRLYVSAYDTVAWQLEDGQAADPSKVHLFIHFPPGNSPFEDEAFHTIGPSPGGAQPTTVPATVDPIDNPPVEFEYYVAVIDETNPDQPIVYTDDPVIHHSGSGTGAELTIEYLKQAQLAASTIRPEEEAAKITQDIGDVLDQVDKLI